MVASNLTQKDKVLFTEKTLDGGMGLWNNGEVKICNSHLILELLNGSTGMALEWRYW
jgi:hypothetical protein